MAQSAFSLDEFRTEVLSRNGLARTNRFEVLINTSFLSGGGRGGPDNSLGRLVSLYVEQASLPLLNIFTKPFRVYGPNYQRPVSSDYGGEGIAFTFHVDRDMKIRSFFEDWMHRIVDPIDFYVSYQAEYATTIEIRQLDEQDNVTYAVELLEAFPRNMNIMELNNASSNQTHRLNVLFAYRYWRPVVSSQAQVVPSSLLNPGIPREDVSVSRFYQNSYNISSGRLGDGSSSGVDLPITV